MSTDYCSRAWSAGFFDGEGHFGCKVYRLRGRPRRQLLVQISQTSREPLDRFKMAVGVGNVYFERHLPSGKPYFVYRAGSHSDFLQVLDRIEPWLSKVKRDQARNAIMVWDSYNAVTRPQVKIAEHGTNSRYNSKKHRCRCDLCRAANTAYHRKRWQTKLKRVS